MQHWNVWKAADQLETHGLASSLPSDDTLTALLPTVISILRHWGNEYGGREEWQGLLNKSSLLHEIEESIVALYPLIRWMDRNPPRRMEHPITLVDVCCGKGVFSTLASYVFSNDPRIQRIIMLDKQDIRWSHVQAANDDNTNNTVPASFQPRPPIEAWGNCDLHSVDEILTRFEALPKPSSVALVGIHLCKTLSPTCVGIVNALGPDRCPFLCLAPCCLPRAVVSQNALKYRTKLGNPVIKVRVYESPSDRTERLAAQKLRDDAKQRGGHARCHLCDGDGRHPIHECHLLPTNETERIDIFRRAALEAPCWKCGEPGHNRDRCPNQTAGKPSAALTRPPFVTMNVSEVLEAESPFVAYCGLLAETVQRDCVRLMETGLTNSKAQHQDRRNWIGGRKSVYIVAIHE